ncbi:MAG: 30S ribosomal protein S8 [Candidatus Handelsmanbacteria bacterium]|nr:30S ribosomal protein S8 [Candidatus Handelsmanbacteria bacterium]
MSMTDPIADMLTRIRNACHARHKKVDVPASKVKRELARIMAEERFIDNFAYLEDGKQGQLRLYLRYDERNQSLIQGLQRVSKPGLRQYTAKNQIPRVLRGLGIAIISTSSGLMTDREARRAGVGGEVVCKIW